METPTYIALSRQLGLQRQMDVVANNMANVNTNGFKAEGMVFSEYLIRAEKTTKLSYVQELATFRDQSEGNIQITGNDLDLTIQGEGYFVVQSPDGPIYTRNGRFQLNADGEVVNQSGYPVMAGGAAVIINPEDGPLNVSEDGVLSADVTQGGNVPIIYGQLDIVSFADPQLLKAAGASGFTADQPAEPTPLEDFKVQQRMLEGSNVNSVMTMTDMIKVQRSYQSIQKFLEGEHERMRRAVNYIIPSS